MMEECTNCGRVIGKLEMPRVFDGNVVCAGCWGVLSQNVPAALAYQTPAPPPPPEQPHVIEQTAKRWKLQLIYAMGTVFLGLLIVFMPGNGWTMAFGGLVFLVGVGWWITARLRAWWHHG
jgi:hypothetical protein